MKWLPPSLLRCFGGRAQAPDAAAWLRLGSSSEVYGSLRYMPSEENLAIEVGSRGSLRQLFSKAIQTEKRSAINTRLNALEEQVYVRLYEDLRQAEPSSGRGPATTEALKIVEEIEPLVSRYLYALESNPYHDMETRTDLLQDLQIILDTFAPHNDQEFYFSAFEYFLQAWGMEKVA